MQEKENVEYTKVSRVERRLRHEQKKLVFVKKMTCAQNVQNLTLVGVNGFLFDKKSRNLKIQCIPVVVSSDIVPNRI